jgi:hypothetical protein
MNGMTPAEEAEVFGEKKRLRLQRYITCFKGSGIRKAL